MCAGLIGLITSSASRSSLLALNRIADEWMTLVRGLEILGHVRIVGCENFHIIGRFRAGPAYDQYEELLKRTSKQEAANWLDALEAVDALGLELVNTQGELLKIRDFQLEAWDQVSAPNGVPVEFRFL